MEERIDQIRDQLCRLDEFQRGGDADAIYGRVPPELMYMMDEFALSVQQKISRSYGDKGVDDNHVKQPKDIFSRELTGIYCGRYRGEQPKQCYVVLALAPKRIKNDDGSVLFDVRTAASKRINEERKEYDPSLQVYY